MDQANGIGEPVPLRQRCFSEAGPDGVVHFQIVDLRRQLFVWVSVGSADLGNLCMATQTRMVRRKSSCSTAALLSNIHPHCLHRTTFLQLLA